MKVPYIEKNCKGCPFNNGSISEPVKISDSFIRYIDCQRDNEAAKEHYMRTLNDENLLWLRQVANLEHCIYAYIL